MNTCFVLIVGETFRVEYEIVNDAPMIVVAYDTTGHDAWQVICRTVSPKAQLLRRVIEHMKAMERVGMGT